jgi:N-acetylneuraminic acid mutarotase
MRGNICFFLFLFNFLLAQAQGDWEWTSIAPLPVATSNNALCEAIVGGEKKVYSFGGITDSLTPKDIHQRVFKYDILSDSWSEESPLPDTLGKIAASASYVNNRIYVMGGYHVDTNLNEYSSNRVHVYNPFIDSFEVDGANIPAPIDDHVQVVWRDSLIYVISGWSNTSNSPLVQVYNPFFNNWETGTPVPNNIVYKAFGASGYILGDTIYYYGGASGNFVFTSKNQLIKGVIDPEDPLEINWQLDAFIGGGGNYKMACSGHQQSFFCIGGAEEAHNFYGMAFSNGEQVLPNSRIMTYNVGDEEYENTFDTDYSPMDLRGIAKLGGGNWMVAGGIDTSGVASSSAYLIRNQQLSDENQAIQPPFFEVTEVGDEYIIETENVGEVFIYDIMGRTLYDSPKSLANLKVPKSKLGKGILLFVFDNDTNVPITIKRVIP